MQRPQPHLRRRERGSEGDAQIHGRWQRFSSSARRSSAAVSRTTVPIPRASTDFDLARLLPSNLLRIWHLQLAILWIATAYVGGALFVAVDAGRQ